MKPQTWLLALLMWAPLWIFTKLSFLRTPIPVNDLGHLITAHIYLPTWTVGMRSSRLPYVVSNLVCPVVKWTEWSTQSPVTNSFPQKPPRVHRPRYHFYLCPGGARTEPAWNCPGFLEKGPLLSEAWESLGSRKNVPDCSLYSALWVFQRGRRIKMWRELRIEESQERRGWWMILKVNFFVKYLLLGR